MYIGKDRQTVAFGEYQFSINAAHIVIKCVKTNKVVFSRGAPSSDNEWYDGPHSAIVKACDTLENALMNAVALSE